MMRPTGYSLAQLARETSMFLNSVPLPRAKPVYAKEAKRLRVEMDRVVHAFERGPTEAFATKVERAASALAGASQVAGPWNVCTDEQKEFYRGVARLVLSAAGMSEGGR